MLKVLLLSLTVFFSSCGAQDFPSLDDFFTKGYETRAEVTDLNNKGISLLANEYFDFKTSSGRVDILSSGNMESYYYMFSSLKVARIRSSLNLCEVKDIDKHDFSKLSTTWGWKYADKQSGILMFGPSSILLKIKSQNLKPVYKDDKDVRGIKTQHFTLEADKATYELYVTKSDWKSPFGDPNRPRLVRFTTKVDQAKDAEDNDLGSLDLCTDFTFIKIKEDENPMNIQVPYGIGCPDLPSVSHNMKTPTSYSFTAEISKAFDKSQVDDSNTIYFHKMTHSDEMKLTRVETFDEKNRGFYEIHDNSTGLLYLFSPDGYCTIKTLEPESSKAEGGLFAGYLFDFFNTKKVYFLGEFMIRDIPCVAWELVKTDSVLNQTIYDKVVVTYFFVKKEWKVIADDAEEYGTISQIMVSGYNLDENKNPILLYRDRINFFNYRIDFFTDMDKIFNVEKCYFTPENRKFIEIRFKSEFESSLVAEENVGLFKQLLRAALSELLDITPLRMPFMSVDFDRNNIFVQMLVLERTEPIKSFILLENQKPRPGDKEFPGGEHDPEVCAEACILDENCWAFFACKDKCYFSINPVPPMSIDPGADACNFYARGGVKAQPQVTLLQFMKKLKETIKDNSFFISLYPEKENKEYKFYADKVDEIHPRAIITRLRDSNNNLQS